MEGSGFSFAWPEDASATCALNGASGDDLDFAEPADRVARGARLVEPAKPPQLGIRQSIQIRRINPSGAAVHDVAAAHDADAGAGAVVEEDEIHIIAHIPLETRLMWKLRLRRLLVVPVWQIWHGHHGDLHLHTPPELRIELWRAGLRKNSD